MREGPPRRCLSIQVGRIKRSPLQYTGKKDSCSRVGKKPVSRAGASLTCAKEKRARWEWAWAREGQDQVETAESGEFRF